MSMVLPGGWGRPTETPNPSRAGPALALLPGLAETGQMNPAIELIGVILLPTAVGYSLLGSVRLCRWVAERRRTTRFRVQEPVLAEPIERLAARMRRLRVGLEPPETPTAV